MGARCAAIGLGLIALGSCSSLEKSLTAGTPEVSDKVSDTDLTARFPKPAAAPLGDPALPQSQIFPASPDQPQSGVAASSEPVVDRGADGFDLNFQNAEIAAVAKVLMGDLLKLNYSVDQRVQGTISLSSGRPIPKADLLPMFESALKLVNANVVKEGYIYKIVPTGEALGNGVVDRGDKFTAGYGISVLKLRYVSAETVLRAIDSFAAKPGAARVDPSRNLLLVQGQSTERASAIEAALSLDVDWMKDQSVGIFPVRNASPDTIIAELRNVFDSGREGTGANLVRFQPINRLNAILAISKTNRMIDEVKTWVARLDRADYDNTTVRVYRLRFGNAKTVAGILKEVFTGQSSSSTDASDLSQLTPGSKATRATNSAAPAGASSGAGNTDPNNAENPAAGSRSNTAQNPANRAGTDIAALSNATGGGGTPIFSNVRITADVANNSLLIYASHDQYKMVERAIFELDRAPLQVAIDVTVAEVTLNNDLNYGVQFYLKSTAKSAPGSVGFGLTDVIQRTVPGANLVLGNGNDINVVLNALKAITNVKVISSPSLVVLDNQKAVLQVGDQVPVTTQQATDATTSNTALVSTVTMTDTGVILTVTPRVNANGVVNLDVIQEVSAVLPQSDPTLTPTISKRKVQTSIAVASGQSVLLGGLISTKTENDRSGIPILSDIKNIGDLFATNTKTTNRTELIMFIRPQIIRDGVDAQLVAEELRSKLTTMGRNNPVTGRRPAKR